MVLVRGLANPWSMAFLPDGQGLIVAGESTGSTTKPPTGFLARFSTKDGQRKDDANELRVQYSGLMLSPDGEFQFSQLTQGRHELRRLKDSQIVATMFLSGTTNGKCPAIITTTDGRSW